MGDKTEKTKLKRVDSPEIVHKPIRLDKILVIESFYTSSTICRKSTYFTHMQRGKAKLNAHASSLSGAIATRTHHLLTLTKQNVSIDGTD